MHFSLKQASGKCVLVQYKISMNSVYLKYVNEGEVGMHTDLVSSILCLLFLIYIVGIY